ncbi:MAG: hypothetical protein ACE5F1_06910 [Planctomycetota bacterium]
MAGLFCACNDSVGGAKAPRISTVPAQSVSGGSTFTLDLSTYVTDGTLTATYAVVSGGGSFAGSVYSQAFPTIGSYTVKFKVTDFRGEHSEASFTVKVTSAELGVVKVGSGVSLYDAGTGNFAEAFQADGQGKTYKTALADGSLVFEFSSTGQTDIHLYNPGDDDRIPVAYDSLKSERYVLKTSTDRILFERGASPERTLHLFDPLNKGVVQVTSGLAGPRDERDAKITTGDIIYFESAGSSGGDIYYYDVAKAMTGAVSTDSGDEDLVAVLPNDAIVYRRQSGTGGYALHYHKKGFGTAEVGNGLGSAYDNLSRVYKGVTSDSRVVFETTSTAGNTDLHIWNPSDLVTTTIASSASDETYRGVTGSARVVYAVEVSATDHDLFVFNPADGTSDELLTSAELENFNASLGNGDIIFTTSDGSDLDLYLYDESVGSSAAIASTATSEVFDKLLADGNFVYTVGGSVHHYDTGTATDTSVTTAAGTEAFAGETSGGGFVIKLTTGGQDDLYRWTGSNPATAVSTDAGTDTFGAATSAGKVLFTRVASGTTTANVFVFDPSDSSTAQLTSNTVNDSVLAVINAVGK